MPTLANNESAEILPGDYDINVDGALEIQRQLYSEPFVTMTSGVFTAAGTGQLHIHSTCNIKVVNAGANTLTYKIR